MDFIERWFGISPDGGNGTLEALYLVVAAMVVMIVVLHRRMRRTIDLED